MKSRSRLFLTLLASVLLHAAVLAVLLWHARSASPERRVAPLSVVEMEVISSPAEPKAPRSPKPAEQPPARASAEPPHRTLRQTSPAQVAPKTEEHIASQGTAPVAQRTEAPPPPESATPRRDNDAPRAPPPLSLLPKDLSGGVVAEEEPSRGHTVHNVPGELPDPEAVKAYEAEQAKARVEAWTSDTLAEARARNGAPAPYYRELQVTFSEQLVNPPPPDAQLLASRFKREQGEAIQRFGKTGSPVVAPEQREQRIEQRNRIQAAAEAGRATNMFMVDVTAPILALAAVVEVWQEPTGKLRDLKLLESSGDPTFDSWAISRLQSALAKAGSPPDAGVGIHEDGIRTRWRLEEYLGNPRVQIHLIGVY